MYQRRTVICDPNFVVRNCENWWGDLWRDEGDNFIKHRKLYEWAKGPNGERMGAPSGIDINVC
jgi:hypothetical protein